MSEKELAQKNSARKERNQRFEKFRKAMFGAMNNHFADLPVDSTRQPQQSGTATKSLKNLKIGIVGGGMAGMYAAMLLQELDIDYQIFEASGERVGGRVLTHYFNNAPHQYAEFGAMRFPKNWMQSRLFNFWKYLNETARATPDGKEIREIPYILFDGCPKEDAGNLLCFNGRKPVTRNEASLDNALLGFDEFFDDPIYDYFKDTNGVIKPAQTLMDMAVEPFMALLEGGDVDKAWAEILKFNKYSGRSYLQEIGDKTRPYPVRIVDYMETVLSYTGVYDLSFIEMLLDNYSFDDTDHWSAMDGGTARVTQEMIKRIPSEKVTMGAKVFRLDEQQGKARVHFKCGDGSLSQVEEFDRVIVTLPFSVLRFIETPEGWGAPKYESIRMLKMTNAVKVALGFKSRFWEVEGPNSKGMKGGQSNTDLAVRSIVYPSFGIGEPGPAYLLGSYCWERDADKFSHLSQQQIIDACLRDVARIHGDVVYEEFIGHGASVVWNKEELTGGGFEFFAPGQFLEQFTDARIPEGLFHFAGEHLDMVHYWIAGAYNSAFRTVWEILILEGLATPENLKTLFESLGGGEILPTMIPHFGNKEIKALCEQLLNEST